MTAGNGGPLVSIIVPAYNTAEYVGETIDSILNQTMRDFEIIFVDDGSTDETTCVVEKKLSGKGINVSFVKQENMGVSAARNSGYALSRGRYVLFFDSDDLMKERCLEKLFGYADELDLDMVFGGFEVYDTRSSRRQKVKNWMKNGRIWPGVYFLKNGWLRKLQSHTHICATLFKRKFLEEENIKFDEKIQLREDCALMWQALLKARRVGVIEDIVFSYLQRPGSLSKNRSIAPGKWFNVLDMKSVLVATRDNSLIKIFENRVAPSCTVSHLRDMILSGYDQDFWAAQSECRTRKALKRAWKGIFSAPDVFVKSFLALHAPALFYRRYSWKRSRSRNL